ncbi:Cell wall protein [Phytophthora cactorum]|nr:Cell wall protein [Phytophthora cactorum]
MVRVFCGSLAVAAQMAVTLATSVSFVNDCTYDISLFDNSAAETIAMGGSTSRDLADGFSGMFRNGMSTEATLAQFAISGGKAWYAISTVPPGAGNCTSYTECAATSGKTGYNVAMSITPDIGNTVVNVECTAVTCASADCEGAYLYPTDDTKLHTCPDTLAIEVAFCPDGSFTSTSTTSTVATEAPAPAVTSTPAATTASVPSVGTTESSSSASTTSTDTSTTTTAITSGAKGDFSSATIRSSFVYSGANAGSAAGTYGKVTEMSSCTTEDVSRGSVHGLPWPYNIYNIAVFSGSSGGDWTKVSSYDASAGTQENMVFMSNLNIDYTGFRDGRRYGYASASTIFGGWLADASDTSVIGGGPCVSTGCEVNIMTPTNCADEDGCVGYYDDMGFHGWDGGMKMFVTKVQMPTSPTANLPAIWMLNAQVVRANQYGCNCRGWGAHGGCGELDVAEVIETNTAQTSVSPGGDNYASRPTDSAVTYVTIFDNSGEGIVKIIEIGCDDFDFSVDSVSADTVYLEQSLQHNLLHQLVVASMAFGRLAPEIIHVKVMSEATTANATMCMASVCRPSVSNGADRVHAPSWSVVGLPRLELCPMITTPVAASVSVSFVNSCSHSISLYDNSKTETIAAGSTTSRDLASGYNGMFRDGTGDEATLAEFSLLSYEACKELTGKSGYNVAISIAPDTSSAKSVSSSCVTVTCESEQCSDAYLYPLDDTKTHSCPDTLPFTVTFCPGGSSSSTSTTTTLSSSTLSTTQSTPTTTAPAVPPRLQSSRRLQVGHGHLLVEEHHHSPVNQQHVYPDFDFNFDTSTTTTSTGSAASFSSATISSSFVYSGTDAGSATGTYGKVTEMSSCTTEDVSAVTLVHGLPWSLNIYNIAVFNATSGSDWTKVSSYSQNGTQDNMVFMNNLNIDYTGADSSPQGYSTDDGSATASSSTIFGGSLADASDASVTGGGPCVSTGCEVNIMTETNCADEDGCIGYYDDMGFHGWDGGMKMFVTKVQMPTGSSVNRPAIWMLNAQVVRANQYGCNCRGEGSEGGCGELDIAEVIETNTNKDKVSTHYYFFDGSVSPGGDNYAARPTDSAVTYVTIIDNSSTGTVKIIELGGDDFDFDVDAVSADQVTSWIESSVENLLSLAA